MTDLTFSYKFFLQEIAKLGILNTSYLSTYYNGFRFAKYSTICTYLKNIFKNTRFCLKILLKNSEFFKKLELEGIEKECVYDFSKNWGKISYQNCKRLSSDTILNYFNFDIVDSDLLILSEYSPNFLEGQVHQSIDDNSNFKFLCYQILVNTQKGSVLENQRMELISQCIKVLSDSLNSDLKFEDKLRFTALSVFISRFIEITLKNLESSDYKTEQVNNFTSLFSEVKRKFLIYKDIYADLKDNIPSFMMLNATSEGYTKFKDLIKTYFSFYGDFINSNSDSPESAKARIYESEEFKVKCLIQEYKILSQDNSLNIVEIFNAAKDSDTIEELREEYELKLKDLIALKESNNEDTTINFYFDVFSEVEATISPYPVQSLDAGFIGKLTYYCKEVRMTLTDTNFKTYTNTSYHTNTLENPVLNESGQVITTPYYKLTKTFTNILKKDSNNLVRFVWHKGKGFSKSLLNSTQLNPVIIEELKESSIDIYESIEALPEGQVLNEATETVEESFPDLIDRYVFDRLTMYEYYEIAFDSIFLI